MTSSLKFLVAAKRCEMADLQHLARAGALVQQCAQAVHELQRERGLSNLYLGSAGERFGGPLADQHKQSDLAIETLREGLDAMGDDEHVRVSGARLYSHMAYALQGLDSLPALRRQVLQQAWRADGATAAYVRLIAALLDVVFEAADHASDPEVSRLLVALFNLMQGKEFTGQERACGAALFASGRSDARRQQRLMHLIDSQERCLSIFDAFASQTQDLQPCARLDQLRRIACSAPDGGPLDTALSHEWFEVNTQRIDRMHQVEEQLAADLRRLCEHRTAMAQADLRRHLAVVARVAEKPEDPLSFFLEPAHAPRNPNVLGNALDQSVLELVQIQATRLQTMASELETARASLHERKLIERAKGLLMAHRRLSEDDAHRTLRQMAMNQNRRLVDVAEALLAMVDVLPPRG